MTVIGSLSTLTLRDELSDAHWIGRWAGLWVGMDALENREVYRSWHELNQDFSVVQHVAQSLHLLSYPSYRNCAIISQVSSVSKDIQLKEPFVVPWGINSFETCRLNLYCLRPSPILNKVEITHLTSFSEKVDLVLDASTGTLAVVKW